MAVIPNSCRECNQYDCVNHQFEWFMKNNPNINNANSVSPNCPLLKEVSQEPILDKINKMKSEIADSLEFWDYSPNNNPLARDILETLTNFWGDIKAESED